MKLFSCSEEDELNAIPNIRPTSEMSFNGSEIPLTGRSDGVWDPLWDYRNLFTTTPQAEIDPHRALVIA